MYMHTRYSLYYTSLEKDEGLKEIISKYKSLCILLSGKVMHVFVASSSTSWTVPVTQNSNGSGEKDVGNCNGEN